MKKNLAVIGMAGNMKDGIVTALASELGMMPMNCGEYIAFAKAMPLEEIVKKTNITYLKKLVSDAARETADLENIVFASCDVAPLSVADLTALKQNCVVVCLCADTKTILSKYSKIKPMSSLLTPEKVDKLNAVCLRRYARYCDFTVRIGKKSLGAVVKEILNNLKTLA